MNPNRKPREHVSYAQPSETAAQRYARTHEEDASRLPVRRPVDAAPRRADWR